MADPRTWEDLTKANPALQQIERSSGIQAALRGYTQVLAHGGPDLKEKREALKAEIDSTLTLRRQQQVPGHQPRPGELHIPTDDKTFNEYKALLTQKLFKDASKTAGKPDPGARLDAPPAEPLAEVVHKARETAVMLATFEKKKKDGTLPSNVTFPKEEPQPNGGKPPDRPGIVSNTGPSGNLNGMFKTLGTKPRTEAELEADRLRFERGEPPLINGNAQHKQLKDFAAGARSKLETAIKNLPAEEQKKHMHQAFDGIDAEVEKRIKAEGKAPAKNDGKQGSLNPPPEALAFLQQMGNMLAQFAPTDVAQRPESVQTAQSKPRGPSGTMLS